MKSLFEERFEEVIPHTILRMTRGRASFGTILHPEPMSQSQTIKSIVEERYKDLLPPIERELTHQIVFIWGGDLEHVKLCGIVILPGPCNFRRFLGLPDDRDEGYVAILPKATVKIILTSYQVPSNEIEKIDGECQKNTLLVLMVDGNNFHYFDFAIDLSEHLPNPNVD